MGRQDEGARSASLAPAHRARASWPRGESHEREQQACGQAGPLRARSRTHARAQMWKMADLPSEKGEEGGIAPPPATFVGSVVEEAFVVRASPRRDTRLRHWPPASVLPRQCSLLVVGLGMERPPAGRRASSRAARCRLTQGAGQKVGLEAWRIEVLPSPASPPPAPLRPRPRPRGLRRSEEICRRLSRQRLARLAEKFAILPHELWHVGGPLHSLSLTSSRLG